MFIFGNDRLLMINTENIVDALIEKIDKTYNDTFYRLTITTRDLNKYYIFANTNKEKVIEKLIQLTNLLNAEHSNDPRLIDYWNLFCYNKAMEDINYDKN